MTNTGRSDEIAFLCRPFAIFRLTGGMTKRPSNIAIWLHPAPRDGNFGIITFSALGGPRLGRRRVVRRIPLTTHGLH